MAEEARKIADPEGLTRYLSRIRRYPLLTRDEEHALAREVAEGCIESRDKLVMANLALVVKIAKQYRNMGLAFEDLINEGSLGMIEAARRFDPQEGARFITYASWWVRKRILEALSNHSQMIRVPTERRRRIRRVQQAQAELSRTRNGPAERSELSAALDESREAIDDLLTTHRRRVDLFHAGADGEARSLDEWLEDPESTRFQDEMMRREAVALVTAALRDLPSREYEVVSCRYGIHEQPQLTLNELGRRLNLSRERVRQIEERGKKRLRKALLRRQNGWFPRPVAAG